MVKINVNINFHITMLSRCILRCLVKSDVIDAFILIQQTLHLAILLFGLCMKL